MSGPGIARGVVTALSVSVMLAAAACGGTDSQPPSTGNHSHTSVIGVLPPGATAPGPGNGQRVPYGLVGERLDVAVKALQGQGLSSSFDPAIPRSQPFRDWGVCSTSPPAGYRLNGKAVVVLHLRHLKCGGGSNSPGATGNTPAVDEVKAAWHQVTEALVRQDGAAACADMTAAARRQFASNGSSCQQVVRTKIGQYLVAGDVHSVSRTKITSVSIHDGRATVNYESTNGIVDLDSAVALLGYGVGFPGYNDMQKVRGKWLLAPSPN